MINRILSLDSVIKHKSVFLLGPRSTGKTSFLKEKYPNAIFINLLRNHDFFRYQSTPDLLIRELAHLPSQVIIIDEVQKLPELLNNVHELIETAKHRFILTGSSARKLRKEGVNLLGGRARKIKFHPFVRKELGDLFNLHKAINIGLIPSVYLSEHPYEELKDYVGLYLKEEIIQEAIVRNLSAFSRFLEIAALCHGQIINFSKISNDAQVPTSTVIEYFKLLQDTLMATTIETFQKTVKRKAIKTAKFYFFDVGIVKTLLNIQDVAAKSKDFGLYFESYIFHELQTYTDYHSLQDLTYWRSIQGHEVDFILNQEIAIEIKSTEHVQSEDLKGLRALKEENILKKYILVSLDQKNQQYDDITCLHIETFLEQLWSDQLIRNREK